MQLPRDLGSLRLPPPPQDCQGYYAGLQGLGSMLSIGFPAQAYPLEFSGRRVTQGLRGYMLPKFYKDFKEILL